MTINIVPVSAQVAFDINSEALEKNATVAKRNSLEFAPGQLEKPDELTGNNDGRDTDAGIADFLATDVPMVRGTYSVHEERCLSTPDFHESAYSRKQPWQEKQTNFGLQLSSYGHFRSFFNAKGDYRNFFDTFGISKAPSFYQQSQTPSFYSDEGNCDETTFHIAKRGTEYQNYRPFAAEARGYMRSYFYGAT